MENKTPSFAAIQDEIAAMLDVKDEELTPEQREMLDEYLSQLGDMEAAKVDAYCSFRREQLDRAESKRNEARRLMAQAKSIESRFDWLDSHYLGVMRVRGLTKINGSIYTISTRKSARVEFDYGFDVATLPAGYKRETVTVEPDKKAIAASLKSGVEVKGCKLVEHMSLSVK